jgi:hypothetical protein
MINKKVSWYYSLIIYHFSLFIYHFPKMQNNANCILISLHSYDYFLYYCINIEKKPKN